MLYCEFEPLVPCIHPEPFRKCENDYKKTAITVLKICPTCIYYDVPQREEGKIE